MKKILFVLALLVSSFAFGQSIGYWRYDTVMLQKIGGNSELNILNGTRTVTNGVLTNVGNGRTRFVLPASPSVTGANNGDTLIGGNIGLGGRLIRTTVINGGNQWGIGFDSVDYAYFQIRNASGKRFQVFQNSISRFQVDNSQTTMASPDGVSTFIRAGNGQAYMSSVLEIYIAALTNLYQFGKDSVTIGSGASTSSVTSYANIYPHRIYAVSDSNITFGSISADQYATDSLVWRSTNRNTHISIYPDSMSLWQKDGEYYVYNLQRITDTTGLDIMAYDRAAQEWVVIPSDIVGGGGGATPTLQQVITAGATLTGDNTIINGANTLTITNNSLAGDIGLSFSSNSAAGITGQIGANVLVTGLMAGAGVSYGAKIINTHTGSSIQNAALELSASGADVSNTALNLAAGDLRLSGSPGASGQVLTSAGIDAVPTWETPGGGSGTVTNVATGYGLSGGPITTTGTLLLDSANIKADSTKAGLVSSGNQFWRGPKSIVNHSVGAVPFTIYGFPGQTASIFQGYKQFGNLISEITPTGSIKGASDGIGFAASNQWWELGYLSAFGNVGFVKRAIDSNPLFFLGSNTSEGFRMNGAYYMGWAPASPSAAGSEVSIGRNATRQIKIETLGNSATNTVLYPLIVKNLTSGTAANGYGVGLQFGVESSTGVERTTSTIESAAIDITNASEDNDIVYKTIVAGALTEVFRMSNNFIRLPATKTPSTAADTGTTGDVAWDASFIYVCTATNTWKRVAIATW